MKQISDLTEETSQWFYVVSDSGEKINIYLYFLPTQQSWFVDVSCDTFEVTGLRVCALPNILDKFHNLIDFGIYIKTEDGYDPWRVDDFSSDYAKFFLLNKEDVSKITEYLDGKSES